MFRNQTCLLHFSLLQLISGYHIAYCSFQFLIRAISYPVKYIPLEYRGLIFVLTQKNGLICWQFTVLNVKLNLHMWSNQWLVDIIFLLSYDDNNKDVKVNRLSISILRSILITIILTIHSAVYNIYSYIIYRFCYIIYWKLLF